MEYLKLNGMFVHQIILSITITLENAKDFIKNSLQSDRAL